jgi:chondroitin 4-sulfotransferase 11
MINHKHKFIFVRVAKTASTSIIESLPKSNVCCLNWKYDCNHVPLWHLKENLDKDIIDTYFTFAFVRNPFERVVSSVKYANIWHRNHGANKHFELKDFVSSLYDISTSNYRVMFRSSKYGSQYDFTKGCDFIGRLENLQQDFNIVCDKIGIPQRKLPYVNESKHKHYTEYYDDETRQIVEEIYAKDIEMFGYAYGE